MKSTNPTPTPLKGKVTGYTLILNFLPVVYIIVGITLVWNLQGPVEQWSFILAWVYLLPILICRITLLIFGYPHGHSLRQETRAYKVWWFLTQWQILFNRVPWLEELLRLVPGLYPLWLNLWGSKVSPLAYWGPGSKIMDRYLARIEPRVVIGTGAALTGHIGMITEDGSFVVDIASVTVRQGAILGANSGIGPGCEIEAHELLPAGRLLQSFSSWKNGHRVREHATEKDS